MCVCMVRFLVCEFVFQICHTDITHISLISSLRACLVIKFTIILGDGVKKKKRHIE